MVALAPYLAVFRARFLITLQYRAAALAGFATQCWWGGLKVMIYAAFFAVGSRLAPMTLAHTVTYTWLGQAFLLLEPWNADPEVAEMVRSGAVAYERLRPVDAWAWWYARALAWQVARILPRAALMFVAAGIVLPLVGLGDWSLRLPPSAAAAGLFAVSLAAASLLSATITVLLNVVVVASMTDRGANVLAAPLAGLLSGGILPLAFFPAWAVGALRAQPFAGLIDTPFRIYFADLSGAAALGAIGLQAVWIVVLAFAGRWTLAAAMDRLQIQGG